MKLLPKNSYYVLAILAAIVFLFYYQILNNNFFSDDFYTVKRLAIDKQFWTPGFFRPLSDMSILLCYNILGAVPCYQYLMNLVLLVLTAFIIYRFCIVYFSNNESKYEMGLLAAILFVIYPFHNEAIVWVVGRGALLACFFGVLSLYFVFSERSTSVRVTTANLFFFIGLLAYESIFPLPIIALMLLYKREKSANAYLLWALSYSLTFLVHLFCRVFFSGSLFGNYVIDGLHLSLLDYAVNFFKSFSRLWILPMMNVWMFVGIFAVLAALIFLVLVYLKKNHKARNLLYDDGVKLFVCLLISLVVPSMFSVSVKSSEGDRLLFFPSVFVVIIITWLTIRLKRRPFAYVAVIGLIAIYFGYNLNANNRNWNGASEIINKTISQIRELSKDEKKAVLINLPDSYRGAYVFRNGFKDALLLNNIDSSKIHFIAPFMRWDYDSTADPVLAERVGDEMLIPNYGKISKNAQSHTFDIIIRDTISYHADMNKESLWLWDKHQYRKIDVR